MAWLFFERTKEVGAGLHCLQLIPWHLAVVEPCLGAVSMRGQGAELPSLCF
jgi:hypothetical protein